MHGFLRGLRLPVLFAALSFLLLHCAGADETMARRPKKPAANTTKSEPRSTELGDDDDDDAAPAGPKLKPRVEPILTFAFDGVSSLRARVKTSSVPAGGSIAVGIFVAEKGEDLSSVDCDALKTDGTQVSLEGATTEGAYTFAEVETQPRIFQGRLDGFTRTVLQGCLFDAQGAVSAKISTSLMNAWDTVSGASKPPVFHGVEGYANSCQDELGELPMFGDGTQDFDCLKDPGMKVVPITATSSNGTVTTLDETTTNWPLTPAQQAATQQCDRPAWLGYGEQNTQCAPFTRIGRYTNSKGTDFVVLCRREAVRALSDPRFDIIAFIGHNPTSGKTCFYNGHIGGGAEDGTKVPPPNTPVADRFYMDYGAMKEQACATCHDADAWVHTPWIDGALDANKKTVLPKLGEDPRYKIDGKYSLHAAESFMTDAQGQRDWAQPRQVTNAGSCGGSCHRIGARASVEYLSQMSVGDTNMLSEFGVFNALTPAFKTQAKLHWMPADAAAMATITACGQNPARCQTAEIPH